jgi:hypothetical protein
VDRWELGLRNKHGDEPADPGSPGQIKRERVRMARGPNLISLKRTNVKITRRTEHPDKRLLFLFPHQEKKNRTIDHNDLSSLLKNSTPRRHCGT